jgi:hypothetical protein
VSPARRKAASKRSTKLIAKPRSFDFVRLTPAQNKRLGYRNSAKRRIRIGAGVTKANTISDRQYTDLVRSERLGENISKERYTQRIRTGELRYRDEATLIRQVNAAHSRTIRTFVPEITPSDKKLALKWYRDGYKSFSDKEKRQFSAMYARYVEDNVRQAFGSAARDIGAFQMVA